MIPETFTGQPSLSVLLANIDIRRGVIEGALGNLKQLITGDNELYTGESPQVIRDREFTALREAVEWLCANKNSFK